MFNYIKNIIKSADMYDHLDDASVEKIGLKHRIPGGLVGGIGFPR